MTAPTTRQQMPVAHRMSLLLIAAAAAVVAGLGLWAMRTPPLPGGLYDPAVRARLLAAANLGPPPHDPTNAVADDPRAIALGEALFFDASLSPSGQVSCATCHVPALGFADAQPRSRGVGMTARHTPTLWNVAYQRWFFWDGRADTLWAQAVGPIEHPAEMGSDRVYVARRLAAVPDYAAAYTALFGALPALADTSRFPLRARPVTDDPSDPLGQAWDAMAPPDQDVVTRVLVNAAKAIAAFERTLTSTSAPFDRFAAALASGDQRGLGVLSPQAQRGAALFFGRANCWLCHHGPLLSDREFHNVVGTAGLPPGTAAALDRGRYDGVAKVLADPLNALGPYSDGADGEAVAKLRYLARNSENLGQFKTPGLRNVAQTAPYMHDGRFASLHQVVDFYATLPGTATVGHREETLVPIALTPQERLELVAFLHALTDEARRSEAGP